MSTTSRRPLSTLTQNANKRDATPAATKINKPAATTSSTTTPAVVKAKPNRAALTATATVTAKPTAIAASAPVTSISSLIAADRARAKASKSASSTIRTPRTLLSGSSLGVALAEKTYRNPHWTARQEKKFVNWINQQLVGQAQPNAEQAEPIVPEALFARYRGQASALLHADGLQAILSKVDSEVDAGRITLKLSSSQLTLDYSLRSSLFTLLYSNLTHFWLRLLVEALSGYEVPKPAGRDQVEQVGREWMFGKEANQGENEAEVAASIVGVDAEGRKRDQLNRTQADARSTLKKVLHLLLLADVCKNARIGGANSTGSRLRAASAAASSSNNGPALFRPTSTISSTSALLTSFSSTYLNEGDITRHLSFHNYRLSYVQDTEDTVDFAVRNLATDLRDGVRLGRLVEVLVKKEQAIAGVTTGRKGGVAVHSMDLIAQMRIPADTEAKKLHNLTVALNALDRSQHGKLHVQSVTTAEDIYSGNQVKTYAFLTSLIMRFDVQQLLSTGELQQEIARIRLAHGKLARKMQASTAAAEAEVSLMLRPQENLYFGPSSQLQSLLTWVQTVVWGQALQSLEAGSPDVSQMRIENFTSSFRSGVAACLIVNYYFPTLLRREEIQQMSQRPDKLAWEAVKNDASFSADGDHDKKNDFPVQQASAAEEVTDEKAWVGSFSCSSVFTIPQLKDQPDFIAARHNYSLVASVLQELGGDISLASVSLASFLASMWNHPEGVPDEKECISFLCALSTRMLILSQEIHAAKRIQKIARRYLDRVRGKREQMASDLAARQAEIAAAKKSAAIARIAAAQEEAERKTLAMKAQAQKRAEREAAEAEAAKLAAEKRAADRAAAQAKQLERQRLEWEAQLREEEEEARDANEAQLAVQKQAEENARLESERVERERAEAEWIVEQAKEAERLKLEEMESEAALRASSAVVIQSSFRCFVARRSLHALRAIEAQRITLAIQHRSATTIQCAFRGWQARRVSKMLRAQKTKRIQLWNSAATIVQCAFRCFMARGTLNFLRAEHAALLEHHRVAATSIQCAWRSFTARQQFSALEAAEAARLTQIRLEHLSAVIIQSAFRCHTAKQTLTQLRSEEAQRVEHIRRCNTAATTIQCAYRVHTAQLRLITLRAEHSACQVLFQVKIHSATAIQSLWRGYSTRQAFNEMRWNTITAVITLQKCARALAAKKTVAQKREEKRVFLAEQQAQLEHHSATTIQCALRCFLARHMVGELRRQRALKIAAMEHIAAIRIQSAYRMIVAQKQLRILRQERVELLASIRIQSIFRMIVAKGQLRVHREQETKRQEFIRHTDAAETIQRAFRCFSARSTLVTLRMERAALIVKQNAAALTIQCAIRALRAKKVLTYLKAEKKAEEELCALQNRSVLTIQCAFRSVASRRALTVLRSARDAAVALVQTRSSAALVIQCSYRCHLARVAYRLRVAERVRAVEEERERVKRRREEMMRIQEQLRELEIRAKILAAERAAEKQRITAATTIQSLFRGRQARKYLASVPSELQAVAEASKFRCAALEKLRVFQLNRSAKLIQRVFRSYITSPSFLAKKLAQLSSVATQIQRLIRGFLARRFAQRKKEAIVTVQRMWRGRHDRKALGKLMAKALASIRMRLRTARANTSAEKQIGSRTRSALEVLLSSTNLSTVLQATQTLDRATFLLPACCRDAVHSQRAIPALIGVIGSLNRSKPHLLLLEATLNVLLNLAQEKSTRAAVFDDAGASVLLEAVTEALQAYSGSPTIVLKLIKFVGIGLEASAALRNTITSTPALLKRFTGVQSLLMRKLALETKSAQSAAGKNGAVGSSSAAAAKKASKSTGKTPTPTFDQFACSCHGLISAAATTSVEKLVSLAACCDHMQVVMDRAQA